MNCLYVGAGVEAFGLIEFKGGIEFIKETLKIDSPFTIVTRKIGSRFYDIYCDDEGLFKEQEDGTILCSACCLNYEEILAGNIMITKPESEEFDNEDMQNLFGHIAVTKDDVVIDYNTSIGVVKAKFEKMQFFLTYEI